MLSFWSYIAFVICSLFSVIDFDTFFDNFFYIDYMFVLMFCMYFYE